MFFATMPECGRRSVRGHARRPIRMTLSRRSRRQPTRRVGSGTASRRAPRPASSRAADVRGARSLVGPRPALLLVTLAAALVVGGCRAPSPYAVPRSAAADTSATSPLEFGVEAPAPRDAKVNRPPEIAAEERLPDGSPPDQKELLEVIEQIDELGDIDPQVREQLMADLRKTKPSLWPAMVQQFRSALAFRRQLESRDAQREAARPPSQEEAIRDALAAVEASPQAAAAPARKGGEVRQGAGKAGPMPPTPDLVALRPGRSSGRISPLEGRSPGPASRQPPGQRSAEQKRQASPPVAASRSGDRTATTTGSGREGARSAIEPGAETASDRPPSGDPAAVPPGKPPAESGRIEPAHLVGQRQQAAATTASPIPVVVPQTQRDLSAMIADLERQTTQPPRTSQEISRHAALRMLYLAAGRREDALRPIPGISPAQQDFWLQQLYGLATYLDAQHQPSPMLRAAAAQRHLREAEQKLGQLGTLTVRNLAFCTEVSSFGVYTEFDTDTFTPGQAVLLYAEIENFTSEQTDEGYRTALHSSYQVLDADGKQVAEHEYAVTEDLCKNHRRDFFMRYFLRLPAKIPNGHYTLELTIEDALANKVGQSSIGFEIRQAGEK